MAVNAVKEQSHKVLGAAVFLAVFNGTEESLVLVKLVLVSSLGNVGQLLINDVTMPICMCCADMLAIQICLHRGQSANPYHPVTHHVPPQHCTKKSGKSAAPNYCGTKPSRRNIAQKIAPKHCINYYNTHSANMQQDVFAVSLHGRVTAIGNFVDLRDCKKMQ